LQQWLKTAHSQEAERYTMVFRSFGI